MSDKSKRILIIVLCVLAVGIAIAAILLSPFGKKGDGNGATVPTAVTSTTEKATEEATKESSPESTTFIVPPSTDATVNPNKNYTIFVDTSVFNSVEKDDGSTSLVAKENSNVKMTLTPVRDKSYSDCCREAGSSHKDITSSARLSIVNPNSVYRSQTGDTDDNIITTVYCVDDNKGGCIIIECEVPVSATKYTETINIMLSMFKVL